MIRRAAIAAGLAGASVLAGIAAGLMTGSARVAGLAAACCAAGLIGSLAAGREPGFAWAGELACWLASCWLGLFLPARKAARRCPAAEAAAGDGQEYLAWLETAGLHPAALTQEPQRRGQA